jgi:hypothetical protein
MAIYSVESRIGDMMSMAKLLLQTQRSALARYFSANQASRSTKTYELTLLRDSKPDESWNLPEYLTKYPILVSKRLQ